MSETIDIMKITEKQLLEMGLAQWMECVDDIKKMGIPVLEQMHQHLEEIQETEDIRYRYFRKCYVSQFMMLESDRESYEQLTKRFFDFMEGTLEYYLWIFNEEAFAGEMEMLPADAKAAVWLNQMFRREEADWQGKLADLKECASCYPVLGTNIKRLIAFIGEETKTMKQADEARNELQQMIEIMKDKIRLMAQQGMIEEALSVLQQVRTLAPQDEELVEIEEVLRG